VSLSPGAILPRDLNSRQWATWAAAQQALPRRDVRTFTPTWAGFGTPPVGNISYIDTGSFVVMFVLADLTGIGNSAVMRITNVPEIIEPIDSAGGTCRVIDDDGTGGVRYPGVWAYNAGTGILAFGTQQVLSAPGTVTDNYNTSAVGVKGLPAGWFVIFPRAS
jgi:hypothetical protein